MGRVDERAHFFVNDELGGLCRADLTRASATGERVAAFVAELDHADLFAHAVLGDHLAGRARGLFDVVRRTGRRIVEHDFLGGATADRVGQLVQQFVAGDRVLVFCRHDHGVAESLAARQDGDLRDRVRVVHRRSDQRVPAFVVGGDHALFVVHQAGALLRTGDHTVNGFVHDRVVDDGLVRTRCEKCGFVHDVCKVSTGETGRALGNGVQVDFISQGLALRVDLEDVRAALHVGYFYRDLTVEAARTQQGRIKHVGPVGGRHEDDVLRGVEAVHFDQQLVERLFAFVVSAAHAGAALTADRVDFVNEDDARRIVLRLLEKVAHTAGADAHVHFDEV